MVYFIYRVISYIFMFQADDFPGEDLGKQLIFERLPWWRFLTGCHIFLKSNYSGQSHGEQPPFQNKDHYYDISEKKIFPKTYFSEHSPNVHEDKRVSENKNRGDLLKRLWLWR